MTFVITIANNEKQIVPSYVYNLILKVSITASYSIHGRSQYTFFTIIIIVVIQNQITC